jgi:hypothetical protein
MSTIWSCAACCRSASPLTSSEPRPARRRWRPGWVSHHRLRPATMHRSGRSCPAAVMGRRLFVSGTTEPLELEFGASKERKYRAEGQRDDVQDEPDHHPDHVEDCGDHRVRIPGTSTLQARPAPTGAAGQRSDLPAAWSRREPTPRTKSAAPDGAATPASKSEASRDKVRSGATHDECSPVLRVGCTPAGTPLASQTRHPCRLIPPGCATCRRSGFGVINPSTVRPRLWRLP